jgi:hypothetical protein
MEPRPPLNRESSSVQVWPAIVGAFVSRAAPRDSGGGSLLAPSHAGQAGLCRRA